MGALHTLPLPDRGSGTICVVGDQFDGWQVSHESASGNSWGELLAFTDAGDAIAAAYRMNRERYDGQSRVYLSDAVLDPVSGDVGPACLPGDF